MSADVTTARVPCDHCGETMHRDCNSFWVGDDETADCSAHNRGHEVDGRPS